MPVSNQISSYRTDFEQDFQFDVFCKFTAIFYDDMDYVPSSLFEQEELHERIKDERDDFFNDMQREIRKALN